LDLAGLGDGILSEEKLAGRMKIGKVGQVAGNIVERLKVARKYDSTKKRSLE